MGLCFRIEDLNIVGYTDANFARDIDDRKSTSGYYSYLGVQLFLG
jgi:hypothetical protein